MMKKYTCLLLILGLMAMPAHASNGLFEQPSIYGAIQSNELTETKESNIGVEVGVKAKKDISDSSYITYGLGYAIKNWENDSILGIKEETKTSWLTVPVNFHFITSEKSTAYIGGYYHLNLSTKASMTILNFTTPIADYPAFKNNYGITFGGSYKVTNSGTLSLDYQLGLSEVSGTNKISTISLAYNHAF
jgi:hypothetical protein